MSRVAYMNRILQDMIAEIRYEVYATERVIDETTRVMAFGENDSPPAEVRAA